MTASTCGFVVVWACLCSDAAYIRADLPETCPHHDRVRAGDVVDLDAYGREGGVRTGHECPPPTAALHAVRDEEDQ